MKLQFSLATLLVCVTVLAVVTAISTTIPVHQIVHTYATDEWSMQLSGEFDRQPFVSEITFRVAWGGPLAVAATLAILWAIRRLKSRRENGPPVG
jgi:ABC-type Fe3+ transport system permease subunit